VTALEEYTGTHPETVEEIMWEWPATRFEVMFQRYQARRQRDLLRRHRDEMIAAIFSNSHFDKLKEPEKARESAVKYVCGVYDDAVEVLYGIRDPGEREQDEVVEAMKKDPLFRHLFNSMESDSRRDTIVRYEQDGMGQAVLA
jgi:hypothetical protein